MQYPPPSCRSRGTIPVLGDIPLAAARCLRTLDHCKPRPVDTPQRQRFGRRHAVDQHLRPHRTPTGGVDAVRDHDFVARQRRVHGVLDDAGGVGLALFAARKTTQSAKGKSRKSSQVVCPIGLSLISGQFAWRLFADSSDCAFMVLDFSSWSVVFGCELAVQRRVRNGVFCVLPIDEQMADVTSPKSRHCPSIPLPNHSLLLRP